MVERSKRSFCNSCGTETNHKIVNEEGVLENINGIDTYDNVIILSCNGCKTPSFITEIWNDKNLVSISYNPPRIWRKPPQWFNQLPSNDTLYELLEEVYTAANDKQLRLLAMGVRAVVDHIMVVLIGDVGTFENKLLEMVNQGFLTKTQSDSLGIVIDAGSASVHRGFKPSRALLQQMLSVMEMIILEKYITGPQLNTMKMQIPPRPSFRKKP